MIVDGVELMRMIRDGKIKDETLIEDKEYNKKFKYNAEIESFYNINEEEYEMMHYYTDKEFASAKFEIISEEIYIQAIEEIKTLSSDAKGRINLEGAIAIAHKINDIIKAVKQLDKKIK